MLLVAPDEWADTREALAPAMSRAGQAYKRALDLAIGCFGLLVAAPVLVALVVAVKIDSRGPAFFSQPRVGRDGKQFRIYKLRTMHVGNDERQHADYVASLIRGEAQRPNGCSSSSTTRASHGVGRVLRKYSLDELPQLWNVVRGDMSVVVGPRPALPGRRQSRRPHVAAQPGEAGPHRPRPGQRPLRTRVERADRVQRGLLAAVDPRQRPADHHQDAGCDPQAAGGRRDHDPTPTPKQVT